MRWQPAVAGVVSSVAIDLMGIAAKGLDAWTNGRIQVPSFVFFPFFFLPSLLLLVATAAWTRWTGASRPYRDAAIFTASGGIVALGLFAAPSITSLTASTRAFGLEAVGGVLILLAFVAGLTVAFGAIGALVAWLVGGVRATKPATAV